MEYLALALVFNTHNIFTEGIGYAVAIETTHFEVCMENLTHKYTCTHTESYICKGTHTMPTDENIFQNVIQLFYLFICLFIN